MKTAELQVLRCLCSPRCRLIAVSLNGTRLTPVKHSGSWDIVEECQVPVKTIEKAFGLHVEEAP